MKDLDLQLEDRQIRTNFDMLKLAVDDAEARATALETRASDLENFYLHSDSPYWDDILVPLTRDKQGQSSKPDFDFTNLGLLFPQNDAAEIVYLIVQFYHNRKNGSSIYPHVHFVQDEAQTPTFKMDYRWYKNGADPTGGFTTITASTFTFTYTSGSIAQIAIFPAIDGSGIDTVSSLMDIKLYRDDNDVTGDVLTKEFDIHYQIDTPGSRTEYAK